MNSKLAVCALLCALVRVASADDALVDRGEYLVRIMDCTACHSGGAMLGQPDPARFLAGSEVGFGGPPPAGAKTGPVVYPPNLTPDPDTGLGAWSDEEILRAFTQGVGRDGRLLSPMMPWASYAGLSREDARAIVAYLRSVPAVSWKAPAAVPPDGQPRSPYLTLVVPQ